MADMYDAGMHAFNSWADDTKNETHLGSSRAWGSQWFGEFNSKMTGAAASERLHQNKITVDGKQAFARGWNQARKNY